MANPFCLHKDTVDAFKKALKDGTIDPEKLVKMDSEGRRAAFEPYMGKEGAEHANRLFEQKMLLKDVQRGMVSWAKKITGMKAEAKRDLISQIERLDERILKPENEQKMLKDLAAQKFGTEVSLDEVKHINDLTQKVKEARAKLVNDKGEPINRRAEGATAADATPEELKLGHAVNDLDGYVTSLKLQAGDKSLLRKIASSAYEFNRKIITLGHGGVIPFTHAKTSLYTPGESKIFARTVGRAYSYLPKESGSNRHAIDMAALRSDPDYDFWKQNGLAINIKTEPVGMGTNRWTNQSFDALKTMRLDLAKKYWSSLTPDMRTPEAAKTLTKVINHATGEVNAPAALAKITKPLMFAPKLRIAKYLSALADPISSQFAAKRMAKLIAVNVGLLAVNDIVNRYFFQKSGNDTVNWDDPTKADWLRMKIGGMTLPMAPQFEMARLPFRMGAVVLDPKEQDKWKVAKTEIASAAHPTLTTVYGILTGKDAWSGKSLPFPGVSQLVYGDKRSTDSSKQMSKYEYGAGFTPIPFQPILKNLAQNGIQMNDKLGPSIIEAFLSGAMGEHAYENVPYGVPKPKTAPKATPRGAPRMPSPRRTR